jgi:hypothetical protein
MAARLGLVGEAQPELGVQIQAHDPLLPAGLQLLAATTAAQQPPIAALAPLGAGQLFQQLARLLQGAHPQQSGQAAAIHHQGER